jgi:MFS-type transporter involved in bile tolerance (Atg22 family)
LSPIISSGAVILGLSGKPVAFIFGAVASIVFAIPFFLMSTNGSASATLEKRTALSLYKKIYKEKHVFYFLIGMMLVSDAILTFQTYVSIFIKRTYAMDDQAAVNVATIGLFFCLVGGMVSSWAVRKSANIFRALMSAIFLYSACFAILAVIPSVRWMVFVAIAVSGLAY